MKEKLTFKINPEILLFMRKSAGMTEEEIAKKLQLSKAKYLSIENGKDRISQIDLIHLADIYKRPLIAFNSVNTSQATELPHDYRLNRDKKISSEVFLAKRKALYLAEELREITGRQTSLPVININVSATELAEKVLALLEVNYNIIHEIAETKPKDETVLGYYKSLIEEKFFIPVVEHPLKSSGVRAFSVYGDVSVMVLNESDTNEVKLFSLFHESCHLLKRQDGICTVDIEKDKNNHPEEKYCDEFAACVLMPEQIVKRKYEAVTSMKQLDSFAKQFGISKLVTLIRMKELNIFNQYQYSKLKTELESVNKKASGRRNWEQTYIKRTSHLVLSNLINAYKHGDLTYASLSTITGIKDKYLQKYI
jgi:Zn-dependent peptidase ImmA (M78 family)